MPTDRKSDDNKPLGSKPEKTLSVRLYGKPIGLLEQTPTGKMQFSYLPEAILSEEGRVLSLGMPLRAEPYDEVRTEAYFGGLLPESEMARKAIGKRHGVSHHNSFALLRAIGYDCAGAVSLHAPSESVENSEDSENTTLGQSFPLSGKVLAEESLYLHIQELPQKPLFLGVEGLRLSLAGAQDKAAICLVDNEIALSQDGCPTTHILKPVIQGFDGIVHNEYVCLKLAKHVGLKVPNVEIRWAKDLPYLLIERYDRVIERVSQGANRENRVQRIHQEDFCQALGIISADKYQKEGGPDFKACFDLLRQTAQPVKDRNTLAALMVFNYLIGNMDAHGKNYSLLHSPTQGIAIAPAYDLICTRVYPALAIKMAMKIGGYYEPDQILRRHWERQCKEVGYSFPALRDLIHKQAATILEAMHTEKSQMQANDLAHPVLEEMTRFLEKHIAQTLKRFEL